MTNATLRRAALAAATCALALAAAGCARPGAGAPDAQPDGTGGLGAAGAAGQAAASPAPSRAPAGGDGTQTGTGGQSGQAGASPRPSHTTTSPTPTGPRIVYFRIKQQPQCPQGTNVYPVPGVPLIIEWKVAGAHEVALSVDDPTRVGSYGRYPTEGTETFTFGCGGKPKTVEKHAYTIYTDGGGTQRHRTLTAEAVVYEISAV